MEYMGINLIDVIFIIVLSPCNHASIVKQGYQYFKSMINYHRITSIMNAQCMPLGRVGRIDEAIYFINSMPIKLDVAM